MNITQIAAIHFSPTYHTKSVLQFLSDALGGLSVEVDLTEKRESYGDFVFSEHTLVCFGVPVYCGRVPSPAAERFRLLHGTNTPAVLVAAYGNRDCGDALAEMRDLAEQNGFVVAAAIAAVTEHSIMREYGAGRPNEQDKQELRTFANQIRSKLERAAGPEELRTVIPGKAPYQPYEDIPLKPSSSEKLCAVCPSHPCVSACPAGAIPVENPAKTDQMVCISCFRCVSLCPLKARWVNPVLLDDMSKKLHRACRDPKRNILLI